MPKAEKKHIGRPRLFSSPEEMEEKINEYFSLCEQTGEPLLLSGICLYLDIGTSTLHDYAQRPDFSEVLKKARMKIEHYIVKNVLQNKLNTAAAIFKLKHCFNWSDKSKVEIEENKTMLDKDKLNNLTDEELKLFQKLVIKMQK